MVVEPPPQHTLPGRQIAPILHHKNSDFELLRCRELSNSASALSPQTSVFGCRSTQPIIRASHCSLDEPDGPVAEANGAATTTHNDTFRAGQCRKNLRVAPGKIFQMFASSVKSDQVSGFINRNSTPPIIRAKRGRCSILFRA